MNSPTWRFVRHYLEMVAAMVVGMVVPRVPTDALLALPDRAAVSLVEMAITMTVPKVAWMRFRGHGWPLSLEMAASMYLPTFAALALLSAGLVEDLGVLMTLEHVAMLLSMLAAMLLRRDEYSGHHHAVAA
jgi:hypothetical protein